MLEMLAVVNGLLLGAIAGQHQETTRVRLVLLACIAGGILATMAGRVSHPDSIYLFLDISLVALSATLGLFSARRLALARRD
jgi:hypothetical protein